MVFFLFFFCIFITFHTQRIRGRRSVYIVLITGTLRFRGASAGSFGLIDSPRTSAGAERRTELSDKSFRRWKERDVEGTGTGGWRGGRWEPR